MKNSKRIAALLLGILLVVSLCACAASNNTPTGSAQTAKENGAVSAAEWSVAVEGANKTEFTSNDYAKLTTVKVDAVLKKKDGSETKQAWEGVLLKDVINALGITEYKSVTLSAADDYSKDYTPDIVNDAKTILGISVNGKKLTAEDGFVQAVAGNQSGSMWIKSLKKIKVNK